MLRKKCYITIFTITILYVATGKYVTAMYTHTYIHTAVIEINKLHMLYKTVHTNEVTCQITQGQKDMH